MSGEQRIRATLFYLSVFIFLAGLPFILSFALSYKFHPRTFKFVRAGLISIKSQPQGAAIYFNDKLLSDKTPATINELLPGKYRLRLGLKDHYSWFGEVSVEAGKATRLEKIILFPLRLNTQQLNQEEISSFLLDEETGSIYYIDEGENIIYKSDLNGENFEEIGVLPLNFAVKAWKISPDKKSLVAFNARQAAVVSLAREGKSISDDAIVLEYSNRKLSDVFWHSDSYHLILITDRGIEVQEADPKSAALNLVNLNKKNITAFYDNGRDILYFMDSQKAEDGKFYDNVYKLELGTKFFPFQELIKPRLNEPNP